MSGLSQQAISKRISQKGHNQDSEKMAEILTAGGLQGHNLILEDTITKWIVRDNP